MSPGGAESVDPSLSVDAQGVARLVLAGPGGGAPEVSRSLLHALDGRLTDVEAAVADGACRALVIISADPGTWLRGSAAADVRALRDAEHAASFVHWAQGVALRLERLPVPSVAAIRGQCGGAGLELALACSYRVAAAEPATRLEGSGARAGLMPLLGGTVRLPRLVGLQTAIELLLTGPPLDAPAAERIGLVDRVFPPARFEEHLARFIAERLRSGRVDTGVWRGRVARLVERSTAGRRLVLLRAQRRLAGLRGGKHLSSRRTLDLLAAGMGQPLEQAFEAAERAFAEVSVSDEIRALLHSRGLSRQLPGVTAQGASQRESRPPIEHVAVVTEGVIGAQAAHLIAYHGVEVRLKAKRQEQLARAAEYVDSLFRDQVERGIIGDRDRNRRLALIRPGLGYGGFGTADLLVLDTQRGGDGATAAALAEVEAHVRPDCIVSLTPPLGGVSAPQRSAGRPERVVGIHLFPLPRVRLVEVVRGEMTAPAVLDATCEFARRLGKTPIVVADLPGFLLHRLACAYFGEALHLLTEGAAVQQIDGAMRAFGMATGPLRLLDDVGLDWYTAAAARIADAWGARLRAPALAERLVTAGHTGRRARQGFYRYARDGREQGTSPELYALVHRADAGAPTPLAPELIERRILYSLVNEAAHILDDGVAASAVEVDLAVLHGLGFPATRGGLLYHAERLGTAVVAAELGRWAAAEPARYAPARWLHASGQRTAAVLE
jgi:3-hydroxyacyl-CoA dehydrogenase / enoyl-CoA hydratase / 3-hydroxybutyryl-CoA epimerase